MSQCYLWSNSWFVLSKFSYHPRSSRTIVSEPGLQSHCKKGLASAQALELSSLTSVAPALELNVFKCSFLCFDLIKIIRKVIYNCMVTSELLKLYTTTVLLKLVVQCALCLSLLCITLLCIVLHPTFHYSFL